jgi:hypothetical protein
MAYLPNHRSESKGIHSAYCLLVVVPAGFCIAAVVIHWVQGLLY